MVGDSTSKINYIKDVLNKEFEISYLGCLEKCLGKEINRYWKLYTHIESKGFYHKISKI